MIKMTDPERKRRNPAIEKRLSEISKDDIRVALVGTITEKDPSINAVMVDDGESSIRVLLPEEAFTRLDLGKLVRVIGIVAPALQGDENELKGEIVQDFSKLDRNLYIEYLKTV